MRILLLGAAGFIGRSLMAELLAGGHEVLAVVRRADGLVEAFPSAQLFSVDLAGALTPQDWAGLVIGVDIIVNAAGLLRGRDMEAVHVAMPRALYHAAQAAGIRRAVLISAISARPEVATDYAQSKLAGEAVLRQSGLDWTILRPSLVYGDGSYGGTSLLRGMAGFPSHVPLPGKGEFEFTPVHVHDLARCVRLMCEDARFAGQTLEPVGPDTMTLRALLGRYRAWLGFGPARFLAIPMPVMHLLARIGDLFGSGPISTNSLIQMIAGNAGDSAAFERRVGFRPRSLEAALSSRPAEVQDRWHARLFFLGPALKIVLLIVWLVSALLGVFAGRAEALRVVQGLGFPADWAEPLRLGGWVLDFGVAALLLIDRRARWSTPVQLAVILGYTLAIGFAVPSLWLDPYGPLLKNFPMLMAVLIHGAIADRR